MRYLSGHSVLVPVLLLLLLTAPAYALHKFKMLFGRPLQGFILQQYSVDEVRQKIANEETAIKQGFFEQILNHSAVKNTADYGKTFKQKYFVNDQFYKPDGPEFLYIGAEAPESGHTLVVEPGIGLTPMMTWARQTGARGWALEHRFYGESRPFERQTNDNLRYLHSEQALADLDNFIQFKNKELKLKKPKWIVFGGSYAGALALWFRQKYPNTVVGAVGSSAPIEPILDYYDYLRVCQDSFASTTWGSPECANAIQTAFSAVQKLMDSQTGRDYLDKVFSLFPHLASQSLDDQSLANFYDNLIGYFQETVQYNRVNGNFYKVGGIPEVCELMQLTSANFLSGLVNVSHYFAMLHGVQLDHLFDSYHSAIDVLKDPNYYGDGETASSRSWIWQTCNEFGFFKSTNIGYNMFGDVIPNSFFINACSDVFGVKINYDYVRNALKGTLARYGGRYQYKGSNVVAPNGKIDPWHPLGIHANDMPDQKARNVVPILIPDTAHCADMHPEHKSDSKELKDARLKIFENIKKWLGFNQSEEVEVRPQDEPLSNTQIDAYVKPVSSAAEKASDSVGARFFYVTKTFNQPVDHTNSSSPIFKQTFYQIDKFVLDLTKAPLILFILLDEPVELYANNETAPIMVMASQLNATLMFVRTRYFGESQLPGDLKVDSLKYLTLSQIVEDIRRIIIGHPGRLAVVTKTILVGSGLAGTIAAHFRKKYPEGTVGALASSAPMDFRLTYPESVKSVQQTLFRNEPRCAEGLLKLFKFVHLSLLTAEDRMLFVDTEIACPEGFANTNYVDPMDKAVFKYTLFQQFLSVTSFVGNEGNKDLEYRFRTLPSYCKLMSNFKMLRLLKLRKAAALNACVPTNYSEFLVPYKLDTYIDPSANNKRVRAYLQCSEVGFLLNTDFGYNFLTNLVTPSFLINVCTDLFGFTHDEMDQRVMATRRRFGGPNEFNAKNVIFTFGGYDGNFAVSFYGKSTGEERVQLTIANAGTSNDLIANVKTLEAQRIRLQILDYFKKWLR